MKIDVRKHFGKAKKLLVVVIVCILPLAGIFLFVVGMEDYSSVTFEKASTGPPGDMTIIADGSTAVIDEMKLSIYIPSIPSSREWVFAHIYITSSCENLSLHFQMGETSNVNFYNSSKFEVFSHSWNYDSPSGTSTMDLSYGSSSCVENRFAIFFEWKILESITYDKRRVTINFVNPGVSSRNSLFAEPIHVILDRYIPKIEELIIGIGSDLVLDSSLTNPQPSYVYFPPPSETSVSWVFGANREASSIQVVFQHPWMSTIKNTLIFRSGLYIAFGTSMIIGGVTEIMAIIRKYLLTNSTV